MKIFHISVDIHMLAKTVHQYSDGVDLFSCLLSHLDKQQYRLCKVFPVSSPDTFYIIETPPFVDPVPFMFPSTPVVS